MGPTGKLRKKEERLMPQKTTDKKDKAKLMYMRFCPLDEITHATGYNKRSLQRWASNGWKRERELYVNALIEDLMAAKSKEIAEIFAVGLPLIKRSLQWRAKGEQLNIKEALMVTDILTAFDKLMRLEHGKPTEITQNIKPVTIDELRNAIKKDEFMTLDAEARSLSDDNDDQEPFDDPLLSDHQLAARELEATQGTDTSGQGSIQRSDQGDLCTSREELGKD